MADDCHLAATLYDAYGTLVFSLAMRILDDVSEAEAVVQKVFVQACAGRACDDEARGSVAMWLLTMTRSHAIQRAEILRGVEGGSSELPPDLAASTISAIGDDRGELGRALALLSADQRQVLELACFHGYTDLELAGIMKLPRGAIRAHIRSALLHLHEAMAPHVCPPATPPRRGTGAGIE